jgi:hypothetical protein
MKRIILGILVVMLLCPVASATGINILSETNHIWGWAGQDDTPGEISEKYDKVSNQAISASASGYYFDYGQLELSKSSASAGNFDIALKAGRWSARALGESTYTFTSDYTNLSLSAFGYIDNTCGLDYAALSLTDLTIDKTIFNYYSYGEPPVYYHVYDFNFTEELNIDPNHTYQLYMFAEAGTGDSFSFSRLNCNISSQQSTPCPGPTPIPEPATMLLMGTGIAGLIGARRKKKA